MEKKSQSRLDRRVSYATLWQLFLTVIATAVVVIPATYYTLTGYLDRKFDDRIKPYEQLVYGLSLVDANLNDDAISEFENGFEGAVKRNETVGTSARLAVYIAGYLQALAFADKPTRFRAQFEKCRELFVRHLLTETPVHLRFEGWYMLRVGEAEKAGEYFVQGLRQAELTNDRFNAGWTLFGLANFELCKGNSKAAYDYQTRANQALPGDEDKFYYRINDPVNMQLANLYPKYANALVELTIMFGNDAYGTESSGQQPADERDPTIPVPEQSPR